tara:strand:- start:620 stop:832 length:213 start_codon:yes stop_codon:yes gene_type:complete
MFQRHWNPYVVLIVAGLLSALYFGLTSTVWAVTDCPGSFRNVPEEAIAHGYTFAQDPVKNGQEYLFYIYA